MTTKHITDIQVLEAYAHRDYSLGKGLQVEDVYDILHTVTGEPVKVCYRAMERAYRRGLIEYGVSLRCGWLTEKGQALLTSSQSDYDD